MAGHVTKEKTNILNTKNREPNSSHKKIKQFININTKQIILCKKATLG